MNQIDLPESEDEHFSADSKEYIPQPAEKVPVRSSEMLKKIGCHGDGPTSPVSKHEENLDATPGHGFEDMQEAPLDEDPPEQASQS